MGMCVLCVCVANIYTTTNGSYNLITFRGLTQRSTYERKKFIRFDTKYTYTTLPFFCFLFDSNDHWAVSIPTAKNLFYFSNFGLVNNYEAIFCAATSNTELGTHFSNRCSRIYYFCIFFPSKQRATRKLHTPILSIRQRWIDFIACSLLCYFTSAIRAPLCTCACVCVSDERDDR